MSAVVDANTTETTDWGAPVRPDVFVQGWLASSGKAHWYDFHPNTGMKAVCGSAAKPDVLISADGWVLFRAAPDKLCQHCQRKRGYV